jgi:hypothetical protein
MLYIFVQGVIINLFPADILHTISALVQPLALIDAIMIMSISREKEKRSLVARALASDRYPLDYPSFLISIDCATCIQEQIF